MPDGDTERFHCPTCRKKYRWKPELAGRKVKCAGCESKLRVPTAGGGNAELLDAPPPPPEAEPGIGDMYELDLPSEPAPKAAAGAAASGGDGKCPNCNTAIKPGAVLCLNCGFNFAEGKVMQTVVGGGGGENAPGPAGPVKAKSGRPIGGALAQMGHSSAVAQAVESGEDAVGHNAFIEKWLPLILIIGGILSGAYSAYVQASDAASFFGTPLDTAQLAMTIGFDVGGTLVLTVPFLLVGIVAAAKIGDIAFGPLTPALFKLTAIAFGAGYLPDVLYHMSLIIDDTGLVGIFVWIFAAVILYWVLLAVMFGLDLWETFVTLGILFIIRNIIISMIITFFTSMFG